MVVAAPKNMANPVSYQNSNELGQARVLIVDDDPALSRAIQRILTRYEFIADIALNGASALELLTAKTYDVVLLDLQMTDMDGMQVFQAAQRAGKPPATILHSAFLDIGTAVQAIRSGVSEVLEKPVPEQLLVDRIRSLIGARNGSAPLRPAAVGPDPLVRLVGESAPMGRLREDIRKVAAFAGLSVLIEGPTGTGKELVAAAIHGLSSTEGPFISVNCAAVPENLFESELFGHDAGAFTNARGARAGLLEEARGGTIFLDEVGEMPLSLQAKMLRVLETREFRRLGSNRNRPLTARVVSATNRNLAHELGGAVRADLFFRLAGYTISTPALSERPEDIPALVEHFLKEFCERYVVPPIYLTPAALTRLRTHDFPGNVRELKAIVEASAIRSRGGDVTEADIVAAIESRYRRQTSGARRLSFEAPAPASADVSLPPPSLPEVEKDMILRTFSDSGNNLSRAARKLGIPRSTLRDRLRRYGVR